MSTGDTLSNILGWVSIACWIVVYSPQIYENYCLQSGEGLSLLFVIVWLLGDLGNLAGAIQAGLLPTIILVAVYYTICDVTLLVQVYYYRWKNARKPSSKGPDAQTPLLNEDFRIPKETPVRVLAMRYGAATAFVFATGTAAWAISGADSGQEGSQVTKELPTGTQWSVQILGWSSAVLYLGARIPQIVKNFKTRCEGLSPALFLFAIVGNVTYALSIVAKSQEKEYLVTNGSWIAGSVLTVFLDIIVLSQFFYYRSVRIAAHTT